MSLNNFLTDFVAGTDPMSSEAHRSRERIFQGSVELHVGERSYLQPRARLVWIYSNIMQRNQGKASSAMQWLTDLADKHGVDLDLTAEPQGGLSKNELRRWYMRHGFTFDRRYNGFRPNKKEVVA
jgi:hypothetical protein